MLWLNMLILPHVMVSVRAAALTIQLPACVIGKQWRMVQDFGNLHPCGRQTEDSCFLTLNQLNPGPYSHFGSELAHGRPSLFVSPSPCKCTFYIKTSLYIYVYLYTHMYIFEMLNIELKQKTL